VRAKTLKRQPASDLSFRPEKSAELSPSDGTFYQFMTAPQGIKSKLDLDENDSFTVGNQEAIHSAAAGFDPSVFKKISDLFSDGDTGLDKLIESLAGHSFTPANIAAAIGTSLKSQSLLKDPGKIGLASVEIAPFLALASGAGTVVHINSENFFYNYGYKPGSTDSTELAQDVKSGRSFGASPGHKALDASDTFYLTELGDFLDKTPAPQAFYQTLLQVLTECDTSGYSKLPVAGQTVATDFFAVYTAELDRNIMASLKEHPWENDLAEVTILSAYGTQAGMIEKNGALVKGDPKDYFGVGTGGSGIGITRSDRTKLQVEVTKAERALHPEIVMAVEKLTNTRLGDDVIHGLMVYLNTPENQDVIKRNADQLTKAVTDFITQIRSDASVITKSIQTDGKGDDGKKPHRPTGNESYRRYPSGNSIS
jgi:hypothetical protein